jgi:predicted molibdopterin-dependent oxidoreductase YjgC
MKHFIISKFPVVTLSLECVLERVKEAKEDMPNSPLSFLIPERVFLEQEEALDKRASECTEKERTFVNEPINLEYVKKVHKCECDSPHHWSTHFDMSDGTQENWIYNTEADRASDYLMIEKALRN